MPGGNRSLVQTPVISLQCDWDEVVR